MTDEADIDLNSLTHEQRVAHAHEKHRLAQLATNAYTLMLPVRASLYDTVKAFSYEARRTGTMPYYIKTMRTLLVWACVNTGMSDDDIIFSMEDELERVRSKQTEYAQKREAK